MHQLADSVRHTWKKRSEGFSALVFQTSTSGTSGKLISWKNEQQHYTHVINPGVKR